MTMAAELKKCPILINYKISGRLFEEAIYKISLVGSIAPAQALMLRRVYPKPLR
jgi:hypothetical protein